jgi:hypothetical protein
MITIHQAQQDITAWITSCDNQLQIATCANVIDTFLTTKIYNVSDYDLQVVKTELKQLCHDQELLIAHYENKHYEQQSLDADSAFEGNWHNENI